ENRQHGRDARATGEPFARSPGVVISVLMDAAKERQIPMILIAVGLALSTIGAIWKLGPAGMPVAIETLVGATVLGTGLMLVAAFATAAMIRASFGELNAAILKLAAIYLFP